MTKIFVIAGTAQEAQSWIAKNYQERVAIGDQQASARDYKFVSHADDVKGYTDPHGVFVGNWLGRPDILEIVQTLLHRSTHVNTALAKIHTQVRQSTRVRPTPKLTGSQITQVYIDEAAKLMAQQIDNEVIKKLMNPTV